MGLDAYLHGHARLQLPGRLRRLLKQPHWPAAAETACGGKERPRPDSVRRTGLFFLASKPTKTHVIPAKAPRGIPTGQTMRLHPALASFHPSFSSERTTSFGGANLANLPWFSVGRPQCRVDLFLIFDLPRRPLSVNRPPSRAAATFRRRPAGVGDILRRPAFGPSIITGHCLQAVSPPRLQRHPR